LLGVTPRDVIRAGKALAAAADPPAA
jgi:AraC family transcriptional regulator